MGTGVLPAFWLETGTLAEIWRAVQATAEQDSVWQVGAVFVLSAGLLAFLARSQRRRIRTALFMFIGAVALILVSAAAAGLGGVSAAKTIHAVGLLLGAFAIVKLASIFVFDVALHLVHFLRTRFCGTSWWRSVISGLGCRCFRAAEFRFPGLSPPPR